MELADLIRLLRSHGVQSATFSEEGGITGIQFFTSSLWTGDPVEEMKD